MQSTVLPIINYERCTHCELCVNGCPEDALEMTKRGPIMRTPIRCTYCSDCEALCPTGAIRVPLTVTWRKTQT